MSKQINKRTRVSKQLWELQPKWVKSLATILEVEICSPQLNIGKASNNVLGAEL